MWIRTFILSAINTSANTPSTEFGVHLVLHLSLESNNSFTVLWILHTLSYQCYSCSGGYTKERFQVT